MTIQISQDAVQKAFDEVKHLRQAYTLRFLNSSATLRSVNDLLSICQFELPKPIKLDRHKDSYSQHTMKSFYLNEIEHFTIVVMNDLNNCWRRFAICKELFHAVLDNSALREPMVNEHVEDLFINQTERNSSQNELIAEFAAMEFLLPYTEREQIERTSEVQLSRQIAERYLIPREYVELYLTERRMKYFKQFNYA